jgi:hypothetical protein
MKYKCNKCGSTNLISAEEEAKKLGFEIGNIIMNIDNDANSLNILGIIEDVKYGDLYSKLMFIVNNGISKLPILVRENIKRFNIAKGGKYYFESSSCLTYIIEFKSMENSNLYATCYICLDNKEFNNFNYSIHTNKINWYSFREATKDEVDWLDRCKKADKYIPKSEPLFYTEDFPDGSFPKKSCNNCRHYKNISEGLKPQSCYYCNDNLDNWSGKLKGQPIYKDKCWVVFMAGKHTPYINHATILFKEDLVKVKYFSNENNAREYYNKLKWEGRLKFKVGNTVINQTALKPEPVTITKIDYLAECYFIKTSTVIFFKDQHEWLLHNFKMNNWYKYEYGTIINYQGGEKGYGFNMSGTWEYSDDWNFIRGANNWKLADINEVKELLMKEAKKRYKKGDRLIGFLDNGDVKPTKAIIERFYYHNCDSITVCCNNGFYYYVFLNGKWAEVEKPKFTTADGVKKYEGDKYILVQGSALNNTLETHKDTVVHKYSSSKGYYKFDKLENAQQYVAEQVAKKRGIKLGDYVWARVRNNNIKVESISYLDKANKCVINRTYNIDYVKTLKELAEQIALKRGIRVGTHVFDKVSNHYLGTVGYIVYKENGSIFVNNIKTFNYNINHVITLEELAKEEGIEIGMTVDGELLKNYPASDGGGTYTYPITGTITELIVENYRAVFVIENRQYYPIVGFKAFKEKFYAIKLFIKGIKNINELKKILLKELLTKK